MSEPIWQFAALEVRPVGSLRETARILGDALGGMDFVEDKSGYYEEFPAFEAARAGLRFALLGIPDPKYDIREEPRSTDFQLIVEPMRSNDPGRKVDISQDIFEEIAKSGLLQCRFMD
jgi:hypothetical protein